SDESTGLHLYEQGELDVAGKIPDADYPRMKAKGEVRTDPFLAVYYFAFNVKKAPFDRAEVRRAVAASIRKSEILSALQSGDMVATGWIPKGLEGSASDLEAPKVS